MKYLLLVMVVVSIITLGTSLKCHQNNLSPLNCKMKTITCNNTEQCYKRYGKIRKSMIASRGCIAPNLCKKTHSSEFAGLTVTLKTLCCNKDLCNGSMNVKISLTMGSVLVLGWLMYFL